MAFINFKLRCSDTKQLIRLVVLVICICVSCYQLAQCFRKIKYPPVSTHYGFYMNHSLRYPAITVCRNPPYKTELFKKYGFSDHTEIDISSTWESFKYDEYTLQEFFEETTYKFSEIIKIASLDKRMDNLNILSSFTLLYGRCYTLSPKIDSSNWGLDQGYFLIFSQTPNQNESEEETFDKTLPGFHINIHHEMETFTEKSQEADIFKEYIYVEAGHGIQVNLKMNKYNQLPTRNNACNPKYNYSKSMCVENSANKIISEAVGCSTPWIPNRDLPSCNTSDETVKMVDYSTPSIYLDNYLAQTDCAAKCNTTTYMAFVQSIRQYPLPKCGIKIYFSSNLYTVMEEVIGYDWNSFLSDLGGSLGFLLGLSVLGMIGLMEELIAVVIRIKGGNKNKMELNNEGAVEDAKAETFVQTKNDFVSENENSLNEKNVTPEYKNVFEFYSKISDSTVCPKEKY